MVPRESVKCADHLVDYFCSNFWLVVARPFLYEYYNRGSLEFWTAFFGIALVMSLLLHPSVGLTFYAGSPFGGSTFGKKKKFF